MGGCTRGSENGIIATLELFWLSEELFAVFMIF